MTKLLSDNAPTNSNMVLWGYRTCEKCPRCGAEIETADHVIGCNDPLAVDVFDASLKKLNEWLIKQQTEPVLRQRIIVTLRNWKRGTPEPLRAVWWDDLWEEQEMIGWHRFMLGFVSKKWALAQQEYYDRVGSRRNGRRWIASMIQKVWDISWDQWRHRNEKIHGGSKLDEFHDPDLLKEQVRVAFQEGAPRPCPAKYRRWFRYTDVDQILTKPALDQRLWLRSVALIRSQLTDLQNETQDMRRNLAAWLRSATPRH